MPCVVSGYRAVRPLSYLPHAVMIASRHPTAGYPNDGGIQPYKTTSFVVITSPFVGRDAVCRLRVSRRPAVIVFAARRYDRVASPHGWIPQRRGHPALQNYIVCRHYIAVVGRDALRRFRVSRRMSFSIINPHPLRLTGRRTPIYGGARPFRARIVTDPSPFGLHFD